MSIYIVEPEIFTIGSSSDTDAVLTASLNAIIANGYGFYPGSTFVDSAGKIRGVFSQIPPTPSQPTLHPKF